MTNSKATVIVGTALFLVAIVGAAPPSQLRVEGLVYCDTCRTQYMTKLSVFLQGAKVRLECKNRTGAGAQTYSAEGVTDKYGKYSLAVNGDHENEICEVSLLQSPTADCSEAPKDAQGARVSLTTNNGMVERVRHVNPLGFLKKLPNPNCSGVLSQLSDSA